MSKPPAPLALVITAHPDDETMFFLPTLRALRLTFHTVWLLCLTTGNYAGLGSVRRRELEAVAEALRLDRLLIVDDPALPDHMTKEWDIDYAARIIAERMKEEIRSEKLDPVTGSYIHVVTFDSSGVSGHLNHRCTFQAAQQFCTSEGHTLWSLDTVHNPVAKYVPVHGWILVLRYWIALLLVHLKLTSTPPSASRSVQEESFAVHYHYDPLLSWRCMELHASQFLWYRRLFVIFSCYSYVNRLQRIQNMAYDKKGA